MRRTQVGPTAPSPETVILSAAWPKSKNRLFRNMAADGGLTCEFAALFNSVCHVFGHCEAHGLPLRSLHVLSDNLHVVSTFRKGSLGCRSKSLIHDLQCIKSLAQNKNTYVSVVYCPSKWNRADAMTRK
eukprot:PhM_4_TR18449/c0_g1_i8/m.72760